MLEAKEQAQLINLLKKVEPGFYPIELFWQFARLNTLGFIEFVPLRINNGDVEVLLIRRGGEDAFWPGKLHVPGCTIRPRDNKDDVFERLLADELGYSEEAQPTYLTTEVRRSARGNELSLVFLVELKQVPKNGDFYSVDNLPDDIIKEYVGLIKLASDSLLKSKSS